MRSACGCAAWCFQSLTQACGLPRNSGSAISGVPSALTGSIVQAVKSMATPATARGIDAALADAPRAQPSSGRGGSRAGSAAPTRRRGGVDVPGSVWSITPSRVGRHGRCRARRRRGRDHHRAPRFRAEVDPDGERVAHQCFCGVGAAAGARPVRGGARCGRRSGTTATPDVNTNGYFEPLGNRISIRPALQPAGGAATRRLPDARRNRLERRALPDRAERLEPEVARRGVGRAPRGDARRRASSSGRGCGRRGRPPRSSSGRGVPVRMEP